MDDPGCSAGDEPPDAAPASGAGRRLTACQAEVLGLCAAGLSTLEAAARLGVSLDEVREHLRSAMGALGARSKLHAVILALRAGLIAPPPG